MKVVATRKGFYGTGDKCKIIDPGEQFDYDLKDGEKLPSWVESLEPIEPVEVVSKADLAAEKSAAKKAAAEKSAAEKAGAESQPAA